MLTTLRFLLSLAFLLLIASCASTDKPIPTDAGPETPRDRAAWELMRLRDPATGRIPEGISARELAFAKTLPQRHGNAFLKTLGVQQYGWQQRGPFNVGGRTRALALDRTGEDTMLAGGVSGGMWRSINGGGSWTRVTRLDMHPSVTCIQQDPRPGKERTWYYGTGELYGNSASDGGAYYYGDGVFKSNDNGVTWERLPGTGSGTPSSFDNASDLVWNLAVDPSNLDQDEIYLAVYGEIRRTTNGGTNWQRVRGGINSAYATDVAVTDSGIVYATLSSDGSQRGIFRLSGQKWTGITPPGWPSTYNRIRIGIAPSNQNIVYFLAETPGAGALGKNFRGDSSWQSLWRYTYLSDDGTGAGGTWENLSANIPIYGTSTGDFFSQGGYDLHVTVDPHNPNHVVIGGTNLYRSTDGFTSTSNYKWIGGYKLWKRDSTILEDYQYPEHHPDQHAAVFSATRPNVLFTASDGGVHRSDNYLADSVTWTSLNNGYFTTQFYTVAIDHATAGSNLMIGGLQDNGSWGTASLNSSAPWVERGTSDGAYCAVVDGGRELYLSKQQGRVYRVLLDQDGNVTGSTRVEPDSATDYMFINPFVLNPSDQKMMFMAAGRYLWRNTDLTAIPLSSTQRTTINWAKLEQSKTDSASVVSAIGVSTTAPANRVWYGTSRGKLYRIDNATSGDPQPVNVTGGEFPVNGYITAINVDPMDGNRAVAVFSNYNVMSLFLTTDAGQTWTAISGNLEEQSDGKGAGPSCRWFAFLHRPNGVLCLVATSTGLYSTNKLDGMNTVWHQEGADVIGNVVVAMIDVRQSDGYVAVATHGNGMFSTVVQALGVDEPAQPTAVFSIYPNPATDHLVVMLPPEQLTEQSEITVYDLTGRAVTEPAYPPIGIATHEIDLTTLPSGNYLCSVKMGERKMVRRVVVR
ncbi:MAG: T9SS type A sorting domain-containing protein [Armatimonadetes bacterium]|nr:T9SS type A sorting domain-containing protein [Armatimonadota bacterium]